ncbi:MAG: metallophosphoesterase [Verrucomicrobiota bacterium]
MPIHLDPLSRRRFVGNSLTLSLAGLTDWRAQAAETSSWALLADTHIVAATEPQEIRGINMAKHLKQVVKELLAESDSLSGVIINGDCALDDGQPGDYAALAEILLPVVESGLPVHFTLGNHDDRVTFYETYHALSELSPVESKHCSVIETPQADWILLDTLNIVDEVEGKLGETQLNWLDEHLAAMKGKHAIIVGHHYPQVFRTDVIPSDEEIKISGLLDSKPFLELISRHSNATAYIFGHSHKWGVDTDEAGIHQINLPPTAYVFDKAQPSGWVKATVSTKSFFLELRSLDPEHPKHGETHELAFRS